MRLLPLSALLLLALASTVPAQPGPFGGSLTVAVTDREGAALSARCGVGVVPVWRGMESGWTAVAFARSFTYEAGRFYYPALHSPNGGAMPPGFTIVIVQGWETMRLRTPDFSNVDIDLGTIPFEPGEYRLPYWFDDLAVAEVWPGTVVRSRDWSRLLVGEEAHLPRITPLLHKELNRETISSAQIDSERVQQEREREPGEAVWLGGGRGVRVGAAAGPAGSRWLTQKLLFERTVDSGAHWVPIIRAHNTRRGGGVVAANGQVFVWWNSNSFDEESILLRSRDGGVVWEPVTIDAPMLDAYPWVIPPFRFCNLRAEGGRLLAFGTRFLNEENYATSIPGEYELLVDLDRTSSAWRGIEQWTVAEARTREER